MRQLPEVCGDAKLFFDPRYPSDLVRQLMRVVTLPVLPEDLRRRGLERVDEIMGR